MAYFEAMEENHRNLPAADSSKFNLRYFLRNAKYSPVCYGLVCYEEGPQNYAPFCK